MKSYKGKGEERKKCKYLFNLNRLVLRSIMYAGMIYYSEKCIIFQFKNFRKNSATSTKTFLFISEHILISQRAI